MPQDVASIDIFIDGGWSTDLGDTLGRWNVEASAGGGRIIRLPWLTIADNLYYELDGGPHKAWGASKLNSVAISGTPIVTGLFEYYKVGTGGSTTRKRLCHAGTAIFKEDLDGTWDSIKSGLESSKIPDYTVFNDLVIIASESGVDVPFSWDQTTFSVLAGSPVNFAFSEKHRNRLWYSGNDAFPSRLYFSGNGDPTDHSGSGAGSLDIDADDGDRITGLKSHKGDLWVFKGPNKGSIHRIVGSAPTGSDFFKHVNYTNEVGAANNRVILEFGSDLAFMNIDGTWHKLTEAPGTQRFRHGSLSAPINTYIEENADLSNLDKAVAINHVAKGLVLCAISTSTSTTTSPNTVVNDTIIGFDYRFDPVRWFRWTFLATQGAASLAIFENSSGVRVPAIGQYDGFVLLGQQATRSWNGSAIIYNWKSPFMNLNESGSSKTISELRVGRNNVGTNDLETTYFLDSSGSIQKNIPQEGGVGLDDFVLDVDTLAGTSYSNYVLSSVEGEFREIAFEMRHPDDSDDADVRMLGMSVENFTPNAEN